MADKKNSPQPEYSIEELLTSLDSLINAVNVDPVPSDSALDPNDIFGFSFLSHDSNEEIIIEETRIFLETLKGVGFPGGVLQYSRITGTMFDNKYIFDGVENISEKILSTAKTHFQLMLEDNLELNQRFYKIIDHIQLASFQIGEISQHFRIETEELVKEIQSSKEELEAAKIEISTSREELENVKKEINEKMNKNSKEFEEITGEFGNITDELSKIYVQFVTILGIFTAIVVSVFGGLSIVSGVFDKLDSTPMWKIILTGSMVSIFVLCLLFLLTRWISTIVRKTYGYDTEQSFMQIITNNGAFATGVFIFCYLTIASVIFSSNEATQRLKQLINVWDAFPILLLLTLPILAGAAVFIKTVDLGKYKK